MRKAGGPLRLLLLLDSLFFLETRNLCYSCLCILSGCVCPCLETRG